MNKKEKQSAMLSDKTDKTDKKNSLGTLKKTAGVFFLLLFSLVCFFGVFWLFGTGKEQTKPYRLVQPVEKQTASSAFCAEYWQKDKSEESLEPVLFVTPKNTAELEKLFADVHLQDDEALQSLPRIYISAFPKDFAQKGNKDLFIKALLPLILKNNEIILTRRIQLQPLLSKAEKGLSLTPEEECRLQQVFDEYDLIGTIQQKTNDLSQMMLPVSPALALAQAAYASDFGKKEQIRVFNQYAWTLPPDEKWEQIPYQNLFDAVKGYALELNSQPTYFKWRQYRTQLFFTKPLNFLNGFLFAKRMGQYMPEKPSYVWHLLNLFKWHQLHRYDTASLDIKEDFSKK